MSCPPHIHPPLFSTSCATAVFESQKMDAFPLSPKGHGWHLGHWLQPRIGWQLCTLMLSFRIVSLCLVLQSFIPPTPWSLTISLVLLSLNFKNLYSYKIQLFHIEFLYFATYSYFSLKVFNIYAYIYILIFYSFIVHLFLVLCNISLISTLK